MELLPIDSFKRWLMTERNYRSKSIKNTVSAVRRLLADVDALTRDGLDDFILNLRDKDYSDAYIENYIIAARVYSAFLKYSGKPYDEGVCAYRIPKKQEAYKAILSDEEIEKLLTYPRNAGNKRNHRMWQLFFSLLAYSGMRPGELAKCTPAHIDWGRMVITLESTMVKTKTTRLIAIPSIIVPQLKEWIENIPAGEYIFTKNSGRQVTDAEWFYEFDKRIRFLGFKRKGITPYSIRHTFCTRLLEEDVNLFKVMKSMGHSNPKTTMVYSHLTTKDLHDTMRKLPVLRSKLDPQDTLESIRNHIQTLHLDRRFSLKMQNEPNRLVIDISY